MHFVLDGLFGPKYCGTHIMQALQTENVHDLQTEHVHVLQTIHTLKWDGDPGGGVSDPRVRPAYVHEIVPGDLAQTYV